MSKKYNTYTTDDYLNDESFVEWARNNTSGTHWDTLSGSEGIDQNAFDQAKLIVKSIKFNDKSPSTETKERVWSKIEAGVSTEKSTSKKETIIRPLWLSIAAAAAIGIFAVLLYPQLSAPADTFQTKIGEHQLITFEDGSSADLNVNSHLKFDYTETARNIELNGEAFFDVEKGKPFTVNTPNGTVKVLGTSFNVRSRGELFFVDCYSGSVQVNIPNSEQQVILEPGETCTLLSGILRLTRHKSQSTNPGWQDSVISFENQSLEDVMNEMSNYYELSVIYKPESLKFKRFTGKVQTNNLEKSIQNITWPLSLEYRLSGNEIVLFQKEED